MVDVIIEEDVPCTCDGELDPNCKVCNDDGAKFVTVTSDRWAALHAHLDQAASDVQEAVKKGLANAEPVFRDKVAPALADATAKLAEIAETARKSTSERAGLTVDDDETPAAQIGGGLAAIATGLLGLSKSLAEWLSHQAHTASEKPLKVKVNDDDDDETFVVRTVEFGDEAESAADVAADFVAAGYADTATDDVQAVADLLGQPVIRAEDGATDVVNPE
jgi:hypothetical protein